MNSSNKSSIVTTDEKQYESIATPLREGRNEQNRLFVWYSNSSRKLLDVVYKVQRCAKRKLLQRFHQRKLVQLYKLLKLSGEYALFNLNRWIQSVKH